MLDEFLEYKQYSYSFMENPCEFDLNRLSKRNIEHNFSGITRALEIVARFELFHGDPENMLFRKTTQTAPEEVIKTLQGWVTGWLISYVKSLYEGSKSKEDRSAEFTKDLKARNALWSKHDLLQCSLNHSTFHKIRYEKTIACALEKGPLRRFVLLEKNDPCSKVKIYDKNGNLVKELSENQRDYILKLTAFFLLENVQRQKSVALNVTDLVHWWVNGSPNTNIFRFTGKKELFEKTDPDQNNNCVKFTGNPAWLKNFALLDITDNVKFQKWLANPKNKGKVYYEDMGSGKLLNKHVVGEGLGDTPH